MRKLDTDELDNELNKLHDTLALCALNAAALLLLLPSSQVSGDLAGRGTSMLGDTLGVRHVSHRKVVLPLSACRWYSCTLPACLLKDLTAVRVSPLIGTPYRGSQ